MATVQLLQLGLGGHAVIAAVVHSGHATVGRLSPGGQPSEHRFDLISGCWAPLIPIARVSMSAIIRFAWGEQDEHCGRHDDVENDHDDQTRSTESEQRLDARMSCAVLTAHRA